MALIDRAAGTEEPKIRLHQFMSVLAEYGRDPFGQPAATRRQFIIDNFDIQTSEEAQLDEFIDDATAKVVALRNGFVLAGVGTAPATEMAISVVSHETHNILMMLESGLYTVAQAKTRLNLT